MATTDENIRARERAATLVEATVCKILQNTCRWLRAPNWLVQGNARGRGGVKNAKDEDMLRRWRPITKLYAHMWLDQPPLGHRPSDDRYRTQHEGCARQTCVCRAMRLHKQMLKTPKMKPCRVDGSNPRKF